MSEHPAGNTTKLSFRQAKATDADVDAAITVACIIEDLHKGYYPASEEQVEEGAPLNFDNDDPDHLRALYDRLMNLTDGIGGGLSRVAGGMHTILYNNILDPDDDCLALHPRLLAQTLPPPTREAMATTLYEAHKAQYRPDSVSLPDWGGLEETSREHWRKIADAAIGQPPGTTATVPIRCYVAESTESNKPPEYWVTIECRGKTLTPNKYTIRGRAEFDAAEWNHVLNGAPKPNILDFDTDPPKVDAPPPTPSLIKADQLREHLQRIVDSHKFNVASLVPCEVHALAFQAIELMEADDGFEWSTPPGWTNKFQHVGRWNAYPIGTRAHAISGGHWDRVVDGWKWCTGDTFPTPGADALDVSIPCKPSQDLDTLRRCLYVAVGDDAKDWEDANGVPISQILLPALAGDVATARQQLESYEAKNADEEAKSTDIDA